MTAKLKVQIFSDRMEISGSEKPIVVTPDDPYAGRRIIVGSFRPAVECLKKGIKKAGATGWLKGRPALIIQAMELNEGGLSEVERRCLLEVGHAAGAKHVEVL